MKDVKINKDLIGKIYVRGNEVYFVSGYDFFTDEYILRRSNRKLFWRGHYVPLTEEIKDKLKTSEELIKELDDKISEIKKIIEIMNLIKDKTLPYTTSNTIGRIKDTKRNIVALETWVERYSKNKDKTMYEFYKKELANHKKGLRRAMKVFYKKISREKYDILMDYLEKNDYPSLYSVEYELKKFIDIKNDIEREKNILMEEINV